jgi:O-antigen ligase
MLGAVAWGGATSRPAQVAVLASLGLLWLFAPPCRLPPRGFIFCAGGLILLAAMAWLPATWFPAESWRVTLQEIGIELPPTHSPQPWLSGEALVWLLAGLGWVAWLLGQGWDAASCRVGLGLLAAGTIAIAAVALASWALHFPVPGWSPDHGFGPFPNRNHTGHVFALGGALALGCAADAARRDWFKAVPWLLGTAVALVALVVNFSRGGLLLFFGATILWCGLEAWRRRSWKLLSIGMSLVLALVSAVLLWGGASAARFAGGADSEVGFRVLIWRDTLSLQRAAPWFGAGLGNFRALFPLYREASVNQQIVLHPESDWLWLATELGWLGVILALGAVFAVLRGAFPLTEGSGRRLRTMALAAAIAALLHSAIDVPGHRFGSVLMALFVLVLARRDSAPETETRIAGALSRICGVAALSVVVVFGRMPDDARRAEALSQAQRFKEADEAASRALKRAPLDWSVYFTRAGDQAARGRTLEAVADFRCASLLEPHLVEAPFAEGKFWVAIQPALALNAWREAIRRAQPPEDEMLYSAMLDAAPKNDAGFCEQMLLLAEGRPALQLVWFQAAPPTEAKAHSETIAAVASQFSPAQREAFERRVSEVGR